MREKMDAGSPHIDSAAGWVDQNAASASRRIFVDSEIHALEIERIFNHTWLFLGHETEIPETGDFVTRPMGGDQVIVSRGEDRAVRVFLNACRHRGTMLCRAGAGNARLFVCPYHSWTFDTAGKLRSTSYDQHYRDADLSQLGLTPVPKVSTYHGLIFGNWDPSALSLEEHLGDLKWYLDILFARTPQGMTVLGPPQRWIIDTNWKIPSLNFLDSQHVLRTHRGPLTMIGQKQGWPPLSTGAAMMDANQQLSFKEGHGVVQTGAAPDFSGHPPEVIPLYKETLPADQYEQFRIAPPSVGTIFPNTSWIESAFGLASDESPIYFLSLRNWQPIGPDKVEIWAWYFAEVEASCESRAKSHQIGVQTFGMAGMFDEDDAEIWSSLSRSIRGPIASRGMMDFSAGQSVPPIENHPHPGIAHPSVLTENAQFGFIKRWNQAMGQVSINGYAT